MKNKEKYFVFPIIILTLVIFSFSAGFYAGKSNIDRHTYAYPSEGIRIIEEMSNVCATKIDGEWVAKFKDSTASDETLGGAVLKAKQAYDEDR